VGGNYFVDLANSTFLLRGYPSGTFVGRKMVNANLEYSIPISQVDKGWGSFPLFVRDLQMALFADTMSVDGRGWQPDYTNSAGGLGAYTRSTLNEFYSSTGVEFRLNTTTGYHIPVSFTLGLYYGFNSDFGGGFSPFLGFGMGDLGGIEHKTP
jgi:outer membrane protein assembly factor BamA